MAEEEAAAAAGIGGARGVFIGWRLGSSKAWHRVLSEHHHVGGEGSDGLA